VRTTSKYGKLVGIDLASSLDSPSRYILKLAAVEWDCNASADEDSITKVTRKINGGTIGLAGRKEWLAKTKTFESNLIDAQPRCKVKCRKHTQRTQRTAAPLKPLHVAIRKWCELSALR
jgi:hypothetical protein